MHKEDNIQAVVSTPRACLILEEKESREQLRRAVEFHETFHQVASFLNTLELESSKHDTGSIFLILSNFASYFSLCNASFEKEVAYFSEKATRKRMEVRLAAMENFVNPSLWGSELTLWPLTPSPLTSSLPRAPERQWRQSGFFQTGSLRKPSRTLTCPWKLSKGSPPDLPSSTSLKRRDLALPQDTNSSSSSLPSRTMVGRSRARRVPLLPPNTKLHTRSSPPFKRSGKEGKTEG